ncbi:aspartic proteinase CDR1-like [Cornus florida]|uniref:aspartic proteinase CDR1-like n=1 Tax=Cornus florida TaxID=4283 RepID=UPI00289D87A6|nr:aspartic proteinase CDR1-like [Cornus florida]
MGTSITSHFLFSTALAITVSIISLSTFSLIEASNGGFSVDLIHRDSPKSPFYNPSLTASQRIANALQRSMNRVSHFMSTSAPPEAPSMVLIPGTGEYLMKISIGTPPVETLVLIDTGSDLIWTQCQPCKRCFKQKYPRYNPKNSSTFKEVSCRSNLCQYIERRSCPADNGSCQYLQTYVDTSYTSGFIATDTVTLGSTTGRSVSLPKIVFGCGLDNVGVFPGGGIIGLGGGELSLISQLGYSIGGKFSYCLVPSNPKSSGKLNFGDNGVVSGAGVVSTPIVLKPPVTYYHLTLEGISVGSERLDFYNSSLSSKASGFSEEGNIVIDSGTTYTFLPPDLYLRLEFAVKKAIPLKPLENPQQFNFNLCYMTEEDFNAPIITAHFKGADVKLKQINTFVVINEHVVCFGFFPTPISVAFFGNVAQKNFLVGYDLQKKTVSFKPC